MPGKPIRIGPFVGGLNNISQAGEAEDDQLVDLVNMEVGLDTALTSRPPIETVPSTTKSHKFKWKVLGIYRERTDVWYAIVLDPKSDTLARVCAYLNGDFTANPVVINSEVSQLSAPTTYVQYVDWGYFNNPNGVMAFRWKPSVATPEDVPQMPTGNCLIAWNDRLWVTGTNDAATSNHVYFSVVDKGGPKPMEWDVNVNYFRVDPGYGGFNTALMSLGNSLYIFKTDATYRFSYPSAPENGSVDKVSGSIGAASSDAVISFDNFCYIYDQGRVYELVNNNFNQINLTVEFKNDPQAPVNPVPGIQMSAVDRRLIVRYFNAIYVYTVDTRSWSQWRCAAGVPSKFVELPGDSTLATSSTYVAATVGDVQTLTENKITDANFIDPVINENRLDIFNHSGYFEDSVLNVDVAVEDTENREIYLTPDGTAECYIPVGPGQKWSFEGTYTSSLNPFELVINYQFRNGSFGQNVKEFTALSGTVTHTVTIPDEVILIAPSIRFNAGQYTFQNPSIQRDNADAPSSILKITNEYINTTPVELIECFARTKTYDYQANSVFKRLFWWGIDIKTPRVIMLKALPLGRRRTTTWGEMEKYTWAELEQGTWGNPLSWKVESLTVSQLTDELINVSENGRFFVKAPKGLRFRQIQFSVSTSTLGNIPTGPVKVYSMTSYVQPKEKVVDTATG